VRFAAVEVRQGPEAGAPPEVDERLARLELAALEQLCELAVTAPDDAAVALLQAIAPRGH
jgi:hypothetical protein